MKNITEFVLKLLILASTALLLSCGSGDNSSTGSSAQVKGTIQISPSTILVNQGTSNTAVTIQLQGSSGFTNQAVTITTNDPGIAYFGSAVTNTATCTLSSGDLNRATCRVFLTGVSAGIFTVTASSSGYQNVTASGQVINSSQKTYGYISVLGANNNIDNISYLASGSGLINIQAILVGSQNIGTTDTVSAKVNSVGGVTFPNGQTCQLTSANSSCNIVAQVTSPSTGTLSTTVVPDSSTSSTNYPVASNTTSVNITGTATPSPSSALGSIAISTTTNTLGQSVFYFDTSGAPKGPLNGPLMATWTNHPTSGSDVYQVTLTSNTSNLRFYSYPAGTTTAIVSTVSNTVGAATSNVQQNCSMSLNSSSQNTSCGFNVTTASTGSATVSCVVNNLSNPGGPVPLCPSSTFNLVAKPTSGRTLTFTNNLANTNIVLGATSGTIASFTGADNGGSQANSATPSHTTQTPSAAGASCSVNSSNIPNAQTACPFGSTCRQGGAVPAVGNAYYCYADLPDGVNNASSPIAPGSSQTVTLPSFWGPVTGTQQIQWSGNFYFYGQDCITAGSCQVSTGAGVGPNVAAVTLAEATFQHNANDYYDVSIINGLNYAVKFGPTAGSGATASSYSCGTAGGGAGENSADIGVSSWAFTPPATNPNIYNLVLPAGTASSAPLVSGYYLSCALTGASCDFNPATAATYTPSGQPAPFYGYVTGDQIYGWNSTSSNYYNANAPFNFGNAVGNGTPSTLINGNLFLCNNGTYTDYTGPTSQSAYLACGGVNWGGNSTASPAFTSTWGGTPSQLTTPSMGVTKVNPVWISTVLPTISWLKQACPSCYTFPYDDMSSTFQCSNISGSSQNTQSYSIGISDINGGTR
jgi:hypothetical protein